MWAPFVFCTIPLSAAEKDSSYRAALESIKADDLFHFVDRLAADDLEGREAGTRGGLAAAEYLAKQYAPLHLHAAGDDGKPSLHVHAVLGLSDGTTRGGHFLNGIVRPTLEVTIVETPAHLHRRKRPELGLALIDLS